MSFSLLMLLSFFMRLLRMDLPIVKEEERKEEDERRGGDCGGGGSGEKRGATQSAEAQCVEFECTVASLSLSCNWTRGVHRALCSTHAPSAQCAWRLQGPTLRLWVRRVACSGRASAPIAVPWSARSALPAPLSRHARTLVWGAVDWGGAPETRGCYALRRSGSALLQPRHPSSAHDDARMAECAHSNRSTARRNRRSRSHALGRRRRRAALAATAVAPARLREQESLRSRGCSARRESLGQQQQQQCHSSHQRGAHAAAASAAASATAAQRAAGTQL